MATLFSLLSDDVVLHSDGGGKALTIKKPLDGHTVVAQFVIAVTRTLSPSATAEETELNDVPDCW